MKRYAFPGKKVEYIMGQLSLKIISKEIKWENYLVKAEPIGNCGTNKPDILPDDWPIFNPNPKDNISLITLKLVRCAFIVFFYSLLKFYSDFQLAKRLFQISW